MNEGEIENKAMLDAYTDELKNAFSILVSNTINNVAERHGLFRERILEAKASYRHALAVVKQEFTV